MVWLEIPRKNGKSAFIAMLAIAHLLEGFKRIDEPAGSPSGSDQGAGGYFVRLRP
jgi:hypothetical protein